MRILQDKKIEGILRCPICKEKMTVPEGRASLVCQGPRTHCYDFAASGYVNMASPHQSGGGDSKSAVRARSAFLDKQYYAPVANALAELAEKHGRADGVLLDAGCGEGYYATRLADKGFSVVGADLSKFAVDAASKRLSREGFDRFLFATASVYELPVADSSVSVVTNVFAPCAEEEYTRVLEDGGVLIVAWAGENHLLGLKKAIYDTAHTNSDRADMPKKLKKVDEIRMTYTIELEGNEDVKSLFAMTPYYWRTSPSDMQKLDNIERLVTEVDIILSVYKK